MYYRVEETDESRRVQQAGKLILPITYADADLRICWYRKYPSSREPARRTLLVKEGGDTQASRIASPLRKEPFEGAMSAAPIPGSHPYCLHKPLDALPGFST